MANYCPECGEPVSGADAFCGECGAALDPDTGGASGWTDDGTGRGHQPAAEGRPTADAPANTTGIPRRGAVSTFRAGLGWVLGLPALVAAFTLFALLNTASTAVAPTAEAIESGQTAGSTPSAVLSLLGSVFGLVVVGAAFVYAERRVTASEVTGDLGEFLDIVTGVARRFLTLFVVALLYVVSTVIGLIFFVLPGVYIGARLSLALPAVVIDDQGVTESLSTSWAVAQGNLLKIVGLVGLVFLCVVGALLVGLPVTAALLAVEAPAADTIGSAATDPIVAVALGAFQMSLARVYLENRDEDDGSRGRQREQRRERDPASGW